MKHEKICQKVFQSKAKKFDSSKQRVGTQEQTQIMKQEKIKANKFNMGGKYGKNEQWREESKQ